MNFVRARAPRTFERSRRDVPIDGRTLHASTCGRARARWLALWPHDVKLVAQLRARGRTGDGSDASGRFSGWEERAPPRCAPADRPWASFSGGFFEKKKLGEDRTEARVDPPENIKVSALRVRRAREKTAKTFAGGFRAETPRARLVKLHLVASESSGPHAPAERAARRTRPRYQRGRPRRKNQPRDAPMLRPRTSGLPITSGGPGRTLTKAKIKLLSTPE